MTPELALTRLWQLAHGEPDALARVTVTGQDPTLPSTFHVGTLAAATIAAAGLAAAECHRLRTGVAQRVDVSLRDALVAFRSERYLRVDGGPPPEPRHPVTGFAMRDARWIQLHANFPHHLHGILDVLAAARSPMTSPRRFAPGRRGARYRAGRGRPVRGLDQERRRMGHARAGARLALPLFEIERIGDAPVEAIGRGEPDRPLAGVRVLDLTRIIAGRSPAARSHRTGADAARQRPAPAEHRVARDRQRPRQALDVDRPARRRRRRRAACAARDADVFAVVPPGRAAARGFAPEALAQRRPGIVCVSVSAYGHAGPWSKRRGFDSLVQSASGIAQEQHAAGAASPRHLPCQALDHATGYLAAFGAMIALARRATQGGSWHVRVSLAQTGRWLQSFGVVPDGLQRRSSRRTTCATGWSGWRRRSARSMPCVRPNACRRRRRASRNRRCRSAATTRAG
jgi:crotonobetainyl-CoA:carnitine CoA-transferase CaiB-like acyl-CoA transferase